MEAGDHFIRATFAMTLDNNTTFLGRCKARWATTERRPKMVSFTDHCRFTAALLLACVLSGLAGAREFDAESDIGLVAENKLPAVAARNTERLTAALQAEHPGGKFQFADGHIGPVLDPIRCAAKEFFFAGTIETAAKNGGCLYGCGGRGCQLPSEQYGPAMGGAQTRFTRIDGETGGAVLRLCGAGFTLGGIELRGRPYLRDSTGEGPLAGTRTPVGIEVEGRTAPPTGRHIIRDCIIEECEYGICARAGYYKAGAFAANENHADQTQVENVLFGAGIDSCFRSENQQAVCWNFINLEKDGFGGRGRRDTVIFDIKRGGDVNCRGLSINDGEVTLFRVSDYSPHTARLTCDGLKWDRMLHEGAYLRLFEYAGPVWDAKEMAWRKWSLRVTGNIANWNTPPAYDAAQLVTIPKGCKLPTDDLLFDVNRIPENGFTRLGRWLVPAN
jgi:hypothetical protein